MIAQRMTPRARVAAVVGLCVVLLGITLAVLSSRGKDGTPTSNASTSAGGTAGIPDMKMSSSPVANGTVTLTASQIRQFGVTFATAEIRPLKAETRTTGVVTVNETRLAQVAPKIGGFVERLYVNATGQRVTRGQPLLELYSPDLVAAQQELLVAGQLQRDMGRSAVPGVPGGTTDLVAAAKRRLQLWDISDAQINDVLRTGRVRRTLTLYAPASGVVLDKRVVQGQAIQPGQELYTIANLADVWVDAQLRETDVAAVQVGSGADIEVAGLPGRTFKGRVTFVYPTLDSASRAVRARIVVSNTDNLLKPGMYATVRLSTPSRSALTVPSSAVLLTGERNVVFMDMGSGQLMPMDVVLGRTAGDYTEVLAGLEPGQRVATSAQFLLDSESNLGEVMKAMLSQMGAGDKSSTGSMQDMPGMNMPGMNDKGADVRGMQQMPGMKTPAASAPSPATPRR